MTSFTDLKDYEGIHDGETIIVAGTGPSLKAHVREVMDYEYPVGATIGVNDCLRVDGFHPRYLLVLDHISGFSKERIAFIKIAKDECGAIFAQDPNDIHKHLSGGRAKTVHIRPRVAREVAAPGAPGVCMNLKNRRDVYVAVTSPFTAISLAAVMGASKIGLIGVDLTHHPLMEQLDRVERCYSRIARACEDAGIVLMNLSTISALRSLKMGTFDDLDAATLP